MKCPNCDQTLVMAERQGVEIDYCPKCRGVWLDKGELDKIIERSAENEMRGGQSDGSGGQSRDEDRFRNDDKYREENKYRDEEYYRKHGKYPYKKKRGFLGDFFDFD